MALLPHRQRAARAGVLITLAAVAAFAPVFLLVRRLERALGWSAAVRVLAVLALVGAQWYLGGTGVNLGDQVRDGSISRPPANGNGGGSGEDNGSSGEDPGGDGGYEAPAGGYGGGAGEEPGEEPGGGAGDDGGEGFGGGGGEGGE